MFKGTYTTADHVDGGPGTNDQIALQGDYSGGVTLSGASITNVEAMALLPGFNYVINSDGTFGQGGTFTFWSVSMTSANGVAIDMTGENTGTTTNFHFFLGQGQDLATGSKGDDLFYGEGGRDTLTGGAGADTFAYLQPSDSSSQTFDFITDFQAGVDRFHFPTPVTGIDSVVNGGQLDLATFDADMTAAIGAGQLAAGHAVLFAPDAGSLAGHLFLIVEASGAAGYQAGLDYAIDVTGGTLAGLSTADFI